MTKIREGEELRVLSQRNFIPGERERERENRITCANSRERDARAWICIMKSLAAVFEEREGDYTPCFTSQFFAVSMWSVERRALGYRLRNWGLAALTDLPLIKEVFINKFLCMNAKTLPQITTRNKLAFLSRIGL